MPKNARRLPRLRAPFATAILSAAAMAVSATAAVPAPETDKPGKPGAAGPVKPDTTIASPATADEVAAMPEGTCKELIEKVKQSDCIRPISRFLDARWNFIYVSVAEQTMNIPSGRKDYVPVENTIKLAYIHDL